MLHTLESAPGSQKNRKRIGRGPGSTLGKTCGRGHKGQKSRSGYSKKVGFEGGQMPLQRRVPKFGFTNINRKEYKGVNLEVLQELADKKKLKKITLETMIDSGLIQRNKLVKVLGGGELKSKLSIQAHAFSKFAIKAIEALEGTAEKI